jgi:hypothetical protein
MEMKSKDLVHGLLGRISRALQVIKSFSGPRPTSTYPRPSQPGLSPNGQVCGQIGSAFCLTGCLISLCFIASTAEAADTSRELSTVLIEAFALSLKG